MHERNIYKIPPNFAELAKKQPFLAPFISLNPTGVPKINFKDQDALRALTKALLLEDFQLNVEIPEDVLVPTVPLRLNYILWVEDLLSYNDGFGRVGSQVCGIDVGTGATAIYALLAAKKNQWRMIGTEIEPESSMTARFNVQQNKLGQIVEIRYVKEESVLGEILKNSSPEQYDFTMCNPPFFGSDEETESLKKSRKEDRPGPSGAKTGTKNELIVSGGELEFILKMIKDSKSHRNSVRIFTTMIGIKKHVKELISKLRSEGVTNLTTTEFSQGKTSRWGLAWSFDPHVHLNPAAQVSHAFEKIPGCLNFEDYIFSQLQTLNFKSLEWIPDANGTMDMDLMTPQGRTLHFLAAENTWTGQRRRRREMERQKKLEEGPPPSKVMKFTSGPEKKNGHDIPMEMEEPCASPSDSILLDSHVTIVREGPKAVISMRLLGGSLTKDGLNQIMTYLRNSYNRDAQNPSTELHQLMECEQG